MAPRHSPSRHGLIRNLVHLALGQVATTALTILLSAAIARTLGAAEFGLLYVATSIATFAYVFVDWGHAPYITREVAQHPERTGELIGSVQVVRLVMAVLICLPVALTTWLLGYDNRTILYAVVIILAWLPSFLAMAYSWIFRGHERMDYDAQINVALRFLSLAISMICLALGGRVLGLILISLASGGLTLVLAIVLYRRLRLPRPQVRWATGLELLRGGTPLLAMAIAVAVQPYITANILYALTTPSVVGWYGVAWNIAGTLVAPSTILSGTLYPRFSRVAADPDALRRALRASFRPLILIAVLGTTGTYLFADVAIDLIYSTEKFGEAANILRAFAPTLLLIYVDMLFGAVSFAVGRVGRLAIYKMASVAVTFGAAVVLVPLFQERIGNGGVGVMLAIAAGEVVMVVALIVITRAVIDVRMVSDASRALMVGAATVVVMRVLPVLPPPVAIPLCVVLYGALSFAIGMITRADTELFLASIRERAPAPEPTHGELLGATQEPSVDPADPRHK